MSVELTKFVMLAQAWLWVPEVDMHNFDTRSGLLYSHTFTILGLQLSALLCNNVLQPKSWGSKLYPDRGWK